MSKTCGDEPQAEERRKERCKGWGEAGMKEGGRSKGGEVGEEKVGEESVREAEQGGGREECGGQKWRE